MIIKRCTHGACDRPHSARGLCQAHYARMRKGMDMDAYMRPARIDDESRCQYAGCDEYLSRYKSRNGKPGSKGLCNTHYRRKIEGVNMDGLTPGVGPWQTIYCRVEGCEKKSSTRSLCGKHYTMFSNYNLSVERISEMEKAAECSNPSCSATEGLHVDHDHSCCDRDARSCGKCVRGWLCGRCNAALGMAGDSVEILEGLVIYLDAYTGGKVHVRDSEDVK